MLPKERHGEFDLDIEEVSGTAHRQEYDNGEFDIRAGQADKKYTSLASKQHLTKAEMEGMASSTNASDSESAGSDQDSEGHGDDDDSSKSVGEEAVDDLAWATSSILDPVVAAPTKVAGNGRRAKHSQNQLAVSRRGN